ncbi:UNVERIFIED_CONTAM: hypothetical protein Slati_4551500 [Sesamum latifolium]|uniref:Reverse transcriptase RNase H-like domain-containing protein n=1 Tax=Sesamum latifolium TaxID=2727402 RepID=A0AAW2S2P8_9LAMI
MALALVITARKLSPYFLSYPIGVRTNTLLKQVLGKPEASGRLVKWAIELSEYDISYLPRTTIKWESHLKRRKWGRFLCTPKVTALSGAVTQDVGA